MKSEFLVVLDSGNSLACHARVSGSIPDMTVEINCWIREAHKAGVTARFKSLLSL